MKKYKYLFQMIILSTLRGIHIFSMEKEDIHKYTFAKNKRTSGLNNINKSVKLYTLFEDKETSHENFFKSYMSDIEKEQNVSKENQVVGLDQLPIHQIMDSFLYIISVSKNLKKTKKVICYITDSEESYTKIIKTSFNQVIDHIKKNYNAKLLKSSNLCFKYMKELYLDNLTIVNNDIFSSINMPHLEIIKITFYTEDKTTSRLLYDQGLINFIKYINNPNLVIDFPKILINLNNSSITKSRFKRLKYCLKDQRIENRYYPWMFKLSTLPEMNEKNEKDRNEVGIHIYHSSNIHNLHVNIIDAKNNFEAFRKKERAFREKKINNFYVYDI